MVWLRMPGIGEFLIMLFGNEKYSLMQTVIVYVEVSIELFIYEFVFLTSC